MLNLKNKVWLMFIDNIGGFVSSLIYEIHVEV
jgi:hypothetical protein